ncbi:MAG: hypothetical protein ACO1Q7_02055 [Gemmatimonas sp.]
MSVARIAVIAIALSIHGSAAWSQAQCKDIQDSLKRLTCYDSVAARTTPVPAEAPTTTAIPDAPAEKYDGAIDQKFDRFANKTTTALKDVDVGVGSFFAFFITDGEKSAKPTGVSLMLITVAPSWKYLRCHDLNFLADGVPIKLASASHNGDVLRGGRVQESIYGIMPTDSFLKLASATKIEGQLCRDEFSFKPPQVAALRALAAKMK